MTSAPTSARQDLYRHVNADWLDNNTIPADQGAYGAFMQLRDEAEEAVRDILEETPQDSLIGALYTAMMDTQRVENAGLEPIIIPMGLIESASSPAELLEVSASLQTEGVAGLITTGSMNDAGNPERMLLHMLQSGLGLPDESYYREEKFADILAAYTDHVTELFGLAGIGGDRNQTRAAAESVVELEKKIASHHWDIVSVRDAVKRYNLMDRAKLEEIFPLASAWIKGLGIKPEYANEVVVWQPDFLQGAYKLLTTQPLDTWKLWLQLKLLSSMAPYLTEAFVTANFEFYGKQLSGTEEIRPRWKRAVSLVNSAFGEDVAQQYVAKHFPEGYKAQMDELVETLLEAYRRSISALDWMGEDTRQKALEKLSMFNPMVGYPVKWIDYSSVEVDAKDLVGSVRAAAAFEFHRDMDKIATGPDPEEWHMTPQTVNAYYSPLENAIVFPAAILQPPFFDPNATPAQNFGGIGAVIGHEIGHGFDDQGSQYSGDGKLENWWTDEDRAAFTARTEKLVDQFNALSPAEAPEHHVNGELTLGENIGDLGGLGIAHKALAIYLEEKDGALAAQGISAEQAHDPQVQARVDQEFFASWATVWRQLTRPETMITRITSDPHSPNEFRCNQIVKNMDAFHTAYGTKPGDAMWLDEDQRVTIW